MDDGIGLAEKMLGLPGLVVLEVDDAPGERVVTVESAETMATCGSCRRRAEAQDRVDIQLRDLHCFGRPTRLVVRKRRWRCRTKRCRTKTWTERIEGIAPRQVLTVRAGAEVTRQVGELVRSVASVAREYGVGWDTAWCAVRHHGVPSSRTRGGSVRFGPSGSTSTPTCPPPESTGRSMPLPWWIWTDGSSSTSSKGKTPARCDDGRKSARSAGGGACGWWPST